MFEKRRDIFLRRAGQDAVARFQEFSKAAQIAQVRLAGERTQALFHAEVGLVVAKKYGIRVCAHKIDYRRGARCLAVTEARREPRSSRYQGEQQKSLFSLIP